MSDAHDRSGEENSSPVEEADESPSAAAAQSPAAAEIEPSGAPAARRTERGRGGALLVASGILLSRLIGLIRERVFAHYFGASPAADAFKAAWRIPNVLQNLLGEGVLSASFIPVYSRLLGNGDRTGARRVAKEVFFILLGVTTVIVCAGTIAAPALIDIITPGFSGERRELAIQLIRIFFPSVGLLVLSAWCLGVLNSHGRFFLPYAVPVLWNLVFIAALLLFGGTGDLASLALLVAAATVLGGALQFLVQLPAVFGAFGESAADTAADSAADTAAVTVAVRTPVRDVLRNFLPVLIGRGVVQVSAFVDSMIASLLPVGGVAALSYVQTIYLLPISLFGMSVSAAELPEMSRVQGDATVAHPALRAKIERGLKQIAFFVVPTACLFVVFGGELIGAVFEGGRFTEEDSRYVWYGLAASTVGLLPATLGRLYSSAFYALGDTRSPLRFSLIRVCVSVGLGIFGALHLPELAGLPPAWGLQGLLGASAIAGLLEYTLLRRALGRRIGVIRLPGDFLLRVWGAAAAGTAAGLGARTFFVPSLPGGIIMHAVAVVALFGATYLGAGLVLKLEEARRFFARVRRR